MTSSWVSQWSLGMLAHRFLLLNGQVLQKKEVNVRGQFYFTKHKAGPGWRDARGKMGFDGNWPLSLPVRSNELPSVALTSCFYCDLRFARLRYRCFLHLQLNTRYGSDLNWAESVVNKGTNRICNRCLFYVTSGNKNRTSNHSLTKSCA